MPPNARPDRRLTYDDFLLFPDDGLRHEIIDGEHYVTPAPNLRHQDLTVVSLCTTQREPSHVCSPRCIAQG
jgi:hypothetical protein